MELTTNLIQTFARYGWELTPCWHTNPRVLHAVVPTKRLAAQVVNNFYHPLSESVANLGLDFCGVRTPKMPPNEFAFTIEPSSRPPDSAEAIVQKLLRNINMNSPSPSPTPLIVTPGVQTGDLCISETLNNLFKDWLQQPDLKAGLIRHHDQRQVAMTYASASLIKGFGDNREQALRDAVKRTRNQYWHPEDLLNQKREVIQNLRPNDRNSIIELPWRGHDRNGENWRRFRTAFQLIQDEWGIIYEVAVSTAEPETIKSPVLTAS